MRERADLRRALGLVGEYDLEAAVQVALGLEALGDQLGVEAQLGAEHVLVGTKPDLGARASRRADLLELARGLAALERDLVALAVALDRDHELGRQRVDHRGTDAVQTARDGVALAALELAARAQRGEDDLGRRLLELRHHVDRDAAAVVLDGGGLAVLVDDDLDLGRVLVDHLVDRVVDDLPQEVVIAVLAGAADEHTRPLADRLEAFEDLDLFAGVLGCHQLTPCPPSALASGWTLTGRGTATSCTRLMI